MDTFAQLHKELDTIAGGVGFSTAVNNQMSTAIQSTSIMQTQLKTTLKPGVNRTDDLVLANKGVWD
jgi:hypothetical protein